MADSGKEIGARCHHCAGPLTKNLETNEWTVSPFIRDSFSMAPPVIVISSACAGLAGLEIISILLFDTHFGKMGHYWSFYLLKVISLAQLASSSYHAGIHSSQPPQGQDRSKLHNSSTISPL